LLTTACTGGAQFGTVELGDLTVDGVVDPDYLYLQLQQLDPTFEACYVRALRSDRSAEGVIEIQMTGSNGRMQAEIKRNGTESSDLADCVTTAMNNLTIVERDSTEPWDFSADWSVEFAIIRRE
jgi:hypothetical protein